MVAEAMGSGPGVTVIRAVPGSGKTLGAIDAVAARKGGKTLWSVQETLTIRKGESPASPAPLAAQVAADFRTVAGGELTRTILGREHLEDEEYREQFKWSTPVAVVSHAHLPVLLQPRLHGNMQVLREATAVVIDEDPLSALALHGGLLPAQGLLRGLPLARMAGVLRPHAETGPQQQAVHMLSRLAQGWPEELAARLADVHCFMAPPPGRGVTQSMLRGPGFWKLMAPALEVLSAADEAQGSLHRALTEHLLPSARRDAVSQGTRERLASFVLGSLLDDFAAYKTGQMLRRFGLSWKGDCASVYPKVLAFDVLQPIVVDRPIVILDAYAAETQYQAVFGPRCRVVNVGARPALRVQLAPHLALDPIRAQTRKEVLVVWEALAHRARSSRGQLLIAPREVHPALRKALTTAAELRGQDGESPLLAHWYSGRGRNAYTGMDTRALTVPHLPAVYQECRLAAVFPVEQAHAERADLSAHHARSELLQLLHRGRQVRSDHDGAPSAVLHGLPCALCPKEARAHCRVQADDHPAACTHWAGELAPAAYQSAMKVKPGSPNPLFAAVLDDVTRDLEVVASAGVPLIALEALGLVVPHGKGQAHSANLLGATRSLLKLGRQPRLLALWAWRRRWQALSGSFTERRRAVWSGLLDPSRDTSRRALEEVLGTSGRGWPRWRVGVAGQLHPLIVWANEEAGARQAVMNVLPGLVILGATRGLER